MSFPSASPIEGFEQEIRSTRSLGDLTLYCRGKGPSVVLLHELPGLTRQTLSYARWLADRGGFRVLLPLLFGAPEPPFLCGLLNGLRVMCVRKEFRSLCRGRFSPVSDALRELCAEEADRTGGQGVGVVGMCLTGSLVLSLILRAEGEHGGVRAPVIAQPTPPFHPADLAGVASQQGGPAVLALRFQRDRWCPASRMRELEEALAGCLIDGQPRLRILELEGRGHSTLVYSYERERRDLRSGNVVDTREEVRSFLQRQLNAGRSDRDGTEADQAAEAE